MKLLYFMFILSLFFSPACDTGKQESSLRLRVAELNQKEQELLAREQLVVQKEQELTRREHLLDSTSIKLRDSTSYKTTTDSLMKLHPHIPGLYNVTMRCTQTNCTGSAVGDTKNEQWNIAYEQDIVVIHAMTDKKLVRIYKGSHLGGGIELEALADTLTTSPAGKIIVRLQETKDNRLDGVREITRQDDCRVIYDLELKKLEASAL
ncbi:MAG TPA: hypothetical protein VEZ17_11670 [Chitinophagaceae bacterium]|nr:hypothetical protein [Chitinophagaceae bacterium]